MQNCNWNRQSLPISISSSLWTFWWRRSRALLPSSSLLLLPAFVLSSCWWLRGGGVDPDRVEVEMAAEAWWMVVGGAGCVKNTEIFEITELPCNRPTVDAFYRTSLMPGLLPDWIRSRNRWSDLKLYRLQPPELPNRIFLKFWNLIFDSISRPSRTRLDSFGSSPSYLDYSIQIPGINYIG